MFNENDFKATLETFCCYDHGAIASEALLQLKKIITNALRIVKIYLTITVKKDWLLTYYHSFGVAKKAAEAAQEKDQ